MNAQRTQQILRLACAATLGLTLTRTADAHRAVESGAVGKVLVDITS